jgi:hypothetical protein
VAQVSKFYQYPNTNEGSVTDWTEFVLHHEGDYHPTAYQLNVSFLLSNWKCQFGNCPGILVSGAHNDISCCQIGVRFGLYEKAQQAQVEWDRVKTAVQELTPEDWDHGYGKDKADEYWTQFRTRKHTETDEETGRVISSEMKNTPYATRVVKGGCIFANRADGPAGKPGCAFHVLAERTGRHHSETKPDVCWMIPFAMGTDYDSDRSMNVVTISGTPGSMWGWHNTEDTSMIGHWCTEIPDAYNGTEPVYRYAEVELRKMMGDGPYEKMAEILDNTVRRYPMPGETVAGGRKLIPLLVQNRIDQWKEKGDVKSLNRAAQSETWLAGYAERQEEFGSEVRGEDGSGDGGDPRRPGEAG